MPALAVIIGSGIIHIYAYVVRFNLLCRQCYVEPSGYEKLCFGRVVDVVGPEVFLVGETRTVEDAGSDVDGYAGMKAIGHLGTHVAHVAHLLGYERAIGKILLVRRAMGVYGEGHALLTYGEHESRKGLDARVGIEHLYLSFVAQVYFCLIVNILRQRTVDAHAGCPDLEAAFVFLRLILILASQCAM